MKEILVVGGAGYIGSHMVRMLEEYRYRPVVLDNLSTGHADAVRDAKLVVADMRNEHVLNELFRTHRFTAVAHFAAHSQVEASMRVPGAYYDNNVAATLALLNAMVRHGVRRFLFSSTAAVYGHPPGDLMNEDLVPSPINPYGRSKLMVETILGDYAAAHGLRYASMRYFNAAGADPHGRCGERHEPETHLIPLLLEVAAGTRDHICVYGRDYDTPDGTCVRDYVHVTGLCRAHELALRRLLDGADPAVFNLGNGRGFSVQQVIEAARSVTGRPIPVVDAPRRPGDPARLVADSHRARRVLGWRPEYPELEVMVGHAWRWARQRTGPEPTAGTASFGITQPARSGQLETLRL